MTSMARRTGSEVTHRNSSVSVAYQLLVEVCFFGGGGCWHVRAKKYVLDYICVLQCTAREDGGVEGSTKVERGQAGWRGGEAERAATEAVQRWHLRGSSRARCDNSEQNVFEYRAESGSYPCALLHFQR